MFGAIPGCGLAAMFGPRPTTLESGITARPKCLEFGITTRPNSLRFNMIVRVKIFKTFFIFLIFFKK
jgi:hypothetical protein